MPTHFWNDADGTKYKNAYFNKFPGKMFLAVITCVTLWCAYVFVNVYFCGTDNILGFIRKNFKFQSVCLCEGVWAHGDHCLINPNTGGIWMLGRRLVLPSAGTITCIFVCI